MRNLIFLTVVAVMMGCTTSDNKKLANVFYAFNNCVRTLPNAPERIEAQAKLIKKLGYDGLSGHFSTDYFVERKALDKIGMNMPEFYWAMKIDSVGNITNKQEVNDVIKDSKDRNLLIAIVLRFKHDNQKKGDPLVVKSMQEIADFAAPYGVKIAIYPHYTNYCETLEHSVRLAKMANRKNVGAIFNLCHFLKVEGMTGWEQKLLDAVPYLFMISIGGAETGNGNTKEMDLGRFILPLGEGTFDTYKLVKLAKDNGYNGLFGLQCINIKQDFEVVLTKSMNTWEKYKERYANE